MNTLLTRCLPSNLMTSSIPTFSATKDLSTCVKKADTFHFCSQSFQKTVWNILNLYLVKGQLVGSALTTSSRETFIAQKMRQAFRSCTGRLVPHTSGSLGAQHLRKRTKDYNMFWTLILLTTVSTYHKINFSFLELSGLTPK